MKLIFVSLLISILGACTNNPSNHVEAAKQIEDTTMYTTISFEDSIINFGTINMGEKNNILFEFNNTGANPLYLTEVKPGCGCTVAEYTKGAIPVGGKGTIIASFDSNKSHPGTVAKNIFVTANTSNGITHTLTFNGEIKQLKTP